VNARERWQALQARLTAAQAYESAGDRKSALREIDAALELDPNFLAAHSLKERLLTAAPPAPVPAPASEPATDAAAGPGYAMFEQRARRRRVDRKIEAARAAIEARRLREAASALDEIIELDPNLPELASLTAQFDDLRRGRTDRHRGPLLVAAASFAVVVLGATWIERSHPTLMARPTTAVAGLVEAAPPVPLTASEPSATDSLAPDPIVEPAAAAAPAPAPTTGVRETASVTPPAPVRESPPPPEPRSEPAVVRTVDVAPEPRNPVTPVVSEASLTVAAPPPAAAPPATRQPESAIIPPVLQPSPSAAATPAPVVRTPSDEQLVRQALQRYRTAYEGLDAPSARAVYPAVNEAALARAFDGLASQSITFDACDVQTRGDVANATCRGSARYVTKVGSREPRTEPRTWTFTLRRAGADWTIENARAER